MLVGILPSLLLFPGCCVPGLSWRLPARSLAEGLENPTHPPEPGTLTLARLVPFGLDTGWGKQHWVTQWCGPQSGVQTHYGRKMMLKSPGT